MAPRWEQPLRHALGGQAIEMTLQTEIEAMGGATRIAVLRERGYSVHAIRGALARGELSRPRNGWVALPGLDPELRFAVAHGVVLSCVSLARRKGLWVSRIPDRPHVAARSRGSHVRALAHVHWSDPLVRRPPGAFVDSLANTLGYVAHCLPREEALAVWESALNKRMIDLQSLRLLPLRRRERELLAECRPYSDSGLETLFKTRLRWLRVAVRAQTWLFGHRVDFLIGDRLVVQIDGAQHGGPQKLKDYSHDAALGLRGYRVVRFGYVQVVHHWPVVQETILEALAQGWHLAGAGSSGEITEGARNYGRKSELLP